jgi:hypothetical protein
MAMRRSHWIRIVLAGLAFSVSACGGSSATTSTSTPSTATTSTAVVASTTTSSGATDAYPLLASFQGHFTGSWNDTTFGTTGSMTWDITADPSARTVKVTVNVGGHFFGGSGAAPESISLTRLGEGAIAGHSSSFGDVSGTITPSGGFHIILSNIGGGIISRVDITGFFRGSNAILMNYTVSFVAGGSYAVGYVTLNRA